MTHETSRSLSQPFRSLNRTICFVERDRLLTAYCSSHKAAIACVGRKFLLSFATSTIDPASPGFYGAENGISAGDMYDQGEHCAGTRRSGRTCGLPVRGGCGSVLPAPLDPGPRRDRVRRTGYSQVPAHLRCDAVGDPP